MLGLLGLKKLQTQTLLHCAKIITPDLEPGSPSSDLGFPEHELLSHWAVTLHCTHAALSSSLGHLRLLLTAGLSTHQILCHEQHSKESSTAFEASYKPFVTLSS